MDPIQAMYAVTPQLWPGNAAMPIIRNTWGGSPYTVNGASHLINLLALGGTNKIFEAGENPAASTDLMPSWRNGYNYQEFSFFWDRTNDGSGSAANWNGVQLGQIATYPFPSAPSEPCIQLRILDAAPYVQLYTAVGDGSTPGATVNATGLTIVPYEGRYVLKINPGVKVEIFGLDRDLGVYRTLCVQADPSKLPVPGASWTKGFSFVVASGGTSWAPKVVYSAPMLLAKNL